MIWQAILRARDIVTFFSDVFNFSYCWIMPIVQAYGNCSCVGDVSTNTSDVRSSAVEGVCEVTSCHTWRLVVYCVILLIAMILIFVAEMFHVASMLRWNSILHIIAKSVIRCVRYCNDKENFRGDDDNFRGPRPSIWATCRRAPPGGQKNFWPKNFCGLN